MQATRTKGSMARRIAVFAAVVLALTLVVPPAKAQSTDDLIRAIKPWLKRQLLGDEQPAVDAVEAGSPAGDEEDEDEEAAAEPAEDEATASLPAGPVPETGSSETEGAAAGSDLAAAPPDTGDAETGDPDAAAAAAAALQDAAEAALAPPGTTLPEALEPTSSPEPTPPPLRFAVLADRSAATTLADVGPIAEELGAAIGRPVELLPMASYSAMVDAQVERRIDGGFYTAAAFALADSRCHCLEPIVAPRAADGTLAYHAIIVARADSGIASAFDLEGKTVAVGTADSLGARRMQLAGLAASGVDPASLFGGVMEAPSANDAVRLVRDRMADAAFAWSSLSGDAGSGYSRGTLNQLFTSGEIAMRDLTIVWRSAAITHGPFAVLKDLGAEEQDKISAFLLALEATRPAAYDRLNPFYGGGYAPVEPQDYGGLETLTAQNVDALRLPRVPLPPRVPEVQDIEDRADPLPTRGADR